MEINNVAFPQYAKSEIDYIKLWNLGRNNEYTRTFIGIAILIGNSNTIPFSKSFFAGGSNDNRAWQYIIPVQDQITMNLTRQTLN